MGNSVGEGIWDKHPVVVKANKKADKINAKALKVANKPVSKNNAGQTGGKLKTDILKNATPARPNRIRAGKTVPTGGMRISNIGGAGGFGSISGGGGRPGQIK